MDFIKKYGAGFLMGNGVSFVAVGLIGRCAPIGGIGLIIFAIGGAWMGFSINRMIKDIEEVQRIIARNNRN